MQSKPNSKLINFSIVFEISKFSTVVSNIPPSVCSFCMFTTHDNQSESVPTRTLFAGNAVECFPVAGADFVFCHSKLNGSQYALGHETSTTVVDPARVGFAGGSIFLGEAAAASPPWTHR